jgi:hypothetical protein
LAHTTKQKLLKRAADLMGKDELAIRLMVSQELLEDWLNGQATMPDRKLVPLAKVLDQFSTKP